MKTPADKLSDIADWAEEAIATNGTHAITDDTEKRRTVPGPRCPADLDRLIALDGGNDHDGLGVLTTWVRAINDERDEAGAPVTWPENTIRACCNWLTDHLRWSTGRGYESELHDDIDRLWATLRRITGHRDPKPLPCLTYGCQGTMTELDGMLTCEHNHRHGSLRKWRYHPSMPEVAVARELNVPAATLRQWRKRGKLHADETKPELVHVWPWDVLRLRYPDLVAIIEEMSAA